MSALSDEAKALAPRGTTLFRLTEQVKPLARTEAPREYRADPPVTYPRSIFRTKQWVGDVETSIRDANPYDSAYGLESQAQTLRERARRESDALLRAADERRADALEQRAARTRADARIEYESSTAALEEANAEQQRFLEDAIRRAVSFDVLSRELLLNKADQLLAMGRADEARVIRASAYRSETRGDTE